MVTKRTASAKKAKKLVPPAVKKTRTGQPQISSAELPRKTLEECLEVARPVHEIYAGASATWDEIASTSGRASQSNPTKYLIWSAQAYDLLVRDGDKYALSETARKIFAPTDPSERTEAIVKAITVPTLLSKFYAEYNGKLIPEDTYFDNVLESRYQVPRGKTQEARELILANAQFAGIMTVHSNGKRTIRLSGAPQAAVDPVSADSTRGVEEAAAADSNHVQSLSVSADAVCFYITPIGEEGGEIRRHADMLLRHLVEPAFQQFSISVVRADKIEKSGLINQQIFEYLVSAKFCVADLSFGNPNAFYELGVRHMIRLPTIQIIRKGDKIPFDVSQGRTIVVDMTDIYTIMDRIESARKELVEHIRNYLAPSDKARPEDNPVSIYLPNLQVRLPK